MALPVLPLNDQADRVQIELLRSAGVARRFGRARSLTSTTISLAREAIRKRLPNASEQEVLLRFVAIHYGEDLARRLRQDLDRRASEHP